MQTLITRGGVMVNGPAAPACLITNAGPGSLYLYRNSAVSTTAYDAVVGPSGSTQWPGGQLWACSDSTATVNLLVGAEAFDSGTTNVAGTVTTTSGGVQFSQKGIAGTDASSWTSTAGATDVIVRGVVSCTSLPDPVFSLTNNAVIGNASGGGSGSGASRVFAKYPCGVTTPFLSGGVAGGMQVEWAYYDGTTYQSLSTAIISQFYTHNFPNSKSTRGAVAKVSVAGPYVRVRMVSSYPALTSPFTFDVSITGVLSSTSVTADAGAGTPVYPPGSVISLPAPFTDFSTRTFAVIWALNDVSFTPNAPAGQTWSYYWNLSIPMTDTYRSGSGGQYQRQGNSVENFSSVSDGVVKVVEIDMINAALSVVGTARVAA